MKMKTKKSAAKRFSLTATGKVKIKKAGLRHNLGSKSRQEKVAKRKIGYLSSSDVKHAYGCLPYGSTR
jgi:large subunit ribosomal protein L35